MPRIDLVLETALYVDELARAGRFYAEVLELRPLFEDERLRAFAVGERSAPRSLAHDRRAPRRHHSAARW
jgi:catechol-2,3-dioxygenase